MFNFKDIFVIFLDAEIILLLFILFRTKYNLMFNFRLFWLQTFIYYFNN